MPDSPHGLILVNRVYEDVDEFGAESHRWDLDFRQLDCGRYHGEIFQVLLGRIMFAEARCTRILQQVGSAPSGMKTIGIPGGDDVRFNWRSQSVTGNDIIVFPNSRELCSVSQSDFHVFTISLPECLLAGVVDRLEAGKVILAMEQERISCPLPMMQQLRAVLRRFVQTVKANPALLGDPSFVRELEFEIPRLCVQAMINERSYSTPCDGWVRGKVVRRSLEFISQNELDSLTVKDVCKTVGVSERTLQYAFLDHFSVTPKAYLKAVRLTGVRRELKRSMAQDTTIAEVAKNWGFWHMGQFAADYRKHFGELPSATRRRAVS